jgi:hypothetical protein
VKKLDPPQESNLIKKLTPESSVPPKTIFIFIADNLPGNNPSKGTFSVTRRAFFQNRQPNDVHRGSRENGGDGKAMGGRGISRNIKE